MRGPGPGPSPRRNKTIVSGVLLFVIVIVVLQLWLFTATVHAFLGGDSSIVLPAGAVSAFCFALVGGLVLYLDRLDR